MYHLMKLLYYCIYHKTVSGQECTDTDIVGSLDHNINIIAAPVDRTYILAGYTVPCSATVVVWEFWYQIGGATLATLNPGIWRKTRTSDVICYTLIRSNELTYNPGGPSNNPRIRKIFNLSDTEQFTVPAGSVVGVYSGSAQLLHTNTDNSITVYEFRQNQNSVNSSGTNVHYNIAIRAHLGKCSGNINIYDLKYSAHVCIAIIATGADLGFSERGANHSSGSLKQGVWGCSPQKL